MINNKGNNALNSIALGVQLVIVKIIVILPYLMIIQT